MTLWTDVGGGGDHNIPTFSSKSVGINIKD